MEGFLTLFVDQAVTCLLIMVSVIPPHLLIKLGHFFLGILFWFVVPVVKAMTPEERARYGVLALEQMG